MIGLRSNFGPSLVLVVLLAGMASAAAIVAARRAVAKGRSPVVAAARALAVGAVAATVVSTALPRRWAIESDGDLVLDLGRGGLGDWRILFVEPASLASIQLVANILLYAAVAFTLTLGWYRYRRWVVPSCVLLSVLVEAVQFSMLGRVAALDDVVLNGAGAVTGYLVAMTLIRLRRWPATESGRRPASRHTDRYARGDRRLSAGLSGRV